MKKRLLVLMMVLAIGTSGVFAAGSGKSFAVGAQWGYPFNEGALTFKVEQLPCVFAAYIGGDIIGDTNVLSFGLSADWWIANPTITGPWGWYYGVGVYGGVTFGTDLFGASIAPRALIGTNVVLLDDFLEFYLQGGWQPTINIGNLNRRIFDPVSFFANFGFRFWF